MKCTVVTVYPGVANLRAESGALLPRVSAAVKVVSSVRGCESPLRSPLEHFSRKVDIHISFLGFKHYRACVFTTGVLCRVVNKSKFWNSSFKTLNAQKFAMAKEFCVILLCLLHVQTFALV